MTDAVAAAAPPAWEGLRAELLRFVRARVGDAVAADDIVHDVLLRALAALEGPRPPVHLRGWLYRATRNAIVDHYRSRHPDEALTEDENTPAGTESAEQAPDEASAERELAGCLTPLLATLPPSYREALALAEVEGLAQREIAARAGLSLSGAKSRVQRARKLLREAILDCCRVEVDRRGGVVDFERRSARGPCAAPLHRPDTSSRGAATRAGGSTCRPVSE
jgi:RNA polymerase sigma-70 factor (ECF subfamily)